MNDSEPPTRIVASQLIRSIPLAEVVQQLTAKQVLATRGGRSLDRMIAAQALMHRATLVTFNPDDFSDVPGLSSLRWPSR
jgi:predicted nucleic acid-binding protein